MGAIARFVMQGPYQAILLAVLFAAIPLMYWVSAAIVALVILRQGLNKGLNVLLPALLPGIVWYALQQEITVFMVVLGCAMMASVLRLAVSLPKAMAASLLLGLAVVVLLPSLSPLWFDILQQGAQQYSQLLTEKDPKAATMLEPWILPLLLGGIAALLQLFAMGALLLARSWQAKMFNPGEFGKEFQALRLPHWYAVVAIVVFFVGISSSQMASWIPVVLAPMFVMGVSLIHGIVAKKQLSSQWIMTFYISLLFFLPYMYALLILMALLDIFIDFRGRLNETAN
ncbi:hypothetical protein A9Q73_00485 [Bermanella sp. 47_1433_sub80_T6]|nr:hypothetical protein A9Q73_00485 [Bermanella sp. 47_1433_sub80_T6]